MALRSGILIYWAVLHAAASSSGVVSQEPGAIPMTLVAKAVEWTTRTTDSVAFRWAGEVENVNGFPMQAVVAVLLHDQTGSVLHRDEHRLPVPAHASENFIGSGEVSAQVAAQGSYWTFEVVADELVEDVASPGEPAEFLARLAVTHRHFTEAPRASLILRHDRVELDELARQEHDFTLPAVQVTRLTRSALASRDLTLHFETETVAGNRITVSLSSPEDLALLLDWVSTYCPNARIEIGFP